MKNSDEPAYPTLGSKINGHDFINYNKGADGRQFGGLTKREMFAMAAMQGILAHSTNYMAANPADAAKDAIKCADKLLKQLDTNP